MNHFMATQRRGGRRSTGVLGDAERTEDYKEQREWFHTRDFMRHAGKAPEQLAHSNANR